MLDESLQSYTLQVNYTSLNVINNQFKNSPTILPFYKWAWGVKIYAQLGTFLTREKCFKMHKAAGLRQHSGAFKTLNCKDLQTPAIKWLSGNRTPEKWPGYHWWQFRFCKWNLQSDPWDRKRRHMMEQWGLMLPLGARCGLLHSWVEEGIAEELQRAAENHSGVVSGLQAGNQQGVLSNSMGILER